MATTSSGGSVSFTTAGVTYSTLVQDRASDTSISFKGEVTSIDLQQGDTYDTYFYYRQVGDSTYTEVADSTGNTSPDVFIEAVGGLVEGQSYEYYFSINQGDGLSGSPQTAQTFTPTSDQTSSSVTTTALPVTSLGSTLNTSNSLVLRGEVESTADLQGDDEYSASFFYKENGTTGFTEVGVGTFTSPQVFEGEVTGLSQGTDYDFYANASGVTGDTLLVSTSLSDGEDVSFSTLAYQQVTNITEDEFQADRDFLIEYELNIDAQGTHELVYEGSVLNTASTPTTKTQSVLIENVDRNGETRTYDLNFTDESGGSGPGDLSKTNKFTIDVIPVKVMTSGPTDFNTN